VPYALTQRPTLQSCSAPQSPWSWQSPGRLRARDPGLLLDAWREAYSFSKHEGRRGHVAARSGDVLLRQLGDALAQRGVEHAATGLGAAWLLTRFAGFRIVTFYIAAPADEGWLREIGFASEPRGANVWLAVPNDAGVFQETSVRDGVRCVHPVQVFLDLKDHPERAEEAASRLRADALNWRSRA
jgi:hypothetical protein